MRHLDTSLKRVGFFNKPSTITLFSVLGIFLLSLCGFVATAFPMLPPLRDITLTSQTSGGNVKLFFKVFDEQRGVFKEGDSGFFQAVVGAPIVDDGVVTWLVNTGISSPSFRVYYSVYDPISGSWRNGDTGIGANYQSNSLMANKGIVSWTSTDGGFIFNTLHFVIFDPQNGGSWKHTQSGYQINSPYIFNGPYIGEGVVGWVTANNNSREARVWGLTFNALSGSWQISDVGHNVPLNAFLAFDSVTSGTIHYHIGAQTFTRGYNFDGSGWYSGTTVPLAYFVPSQTGGNVPLKTYFWDLSVGASSWSWNFGDGNTSATQSPFYTYNSAAGTPYTVTQTVSGPGGTRSRTATITPTTPHSISGNAANAGGFKIAGATVTLSGTISRTTQTDANGNFSFTNLTGGGNYTVSIAKSGYTFSPATRSFNNLSGSQSGNFTGKLNDKPSDFDGDGKTDGSIFRTSTNYWWILNSSNGASSATSFGSASIDKITPRDFDGDGKTDIAVFRPSDGIWYIIRSSNGTIQYSYFGTTGDIPVAGDYDGDDKADAAIFRPTEGKWYIQKSSDAQLYVETFGLSTDKLVPADYDGDNRTDVAVWRDSDATWYIMKSSTGYYGEQYGSIGDKPVQGDYDGDGKADLATFRPGDAKWRVKSSLTSSETVTSWGYSTDILTPGDYDGDGKYDLTVFRPSDGIWYVLRSSDQNIAGIYWGTSGDYPTPSSYIPE